MPDEHPGIGDGAGQEPVSHAGEGDDPETDAAKVDIALATFLLSHFGHSILLKSLLDRRRTSNPWPHFLQAYS